MNHRRIVHLCNVKEVARLKRLNSKVLISFFYPFVSWFHNNKKYNSVASLWFGGELNSLLQFPSISGYLHKYNDLCLFEL